MKKVLAEPKVSIIVPVYNTAKYLPACIESLIGQTYQNLEIILVDDGATDDSGKIADEYAKKDTRIKVVHQKNGGQSAARNRGLALATGEFISFVDGDDSIASDFISNLLRVFSSKVSLSVCGIHYKYLAKNSSKDVYINSLPKRSHQSKKAYMLKLLAIDGRMYSSVNKLYRSDIAKTIKFDETINFAEDTKFVLDYLDKATGEIKFVLKPSYIYNSGTENSTMKSVAANWDNWKKSYNNLKSWLGPRPNLREKFWLHMVRLRWKVSCSKQKRKQSPKSKNTNVKTSRYAIRYFFIGVGVTAFNYVLFIALSNMLIKDNGLLWLSSLIATAITTILAYILHSRITWRERKISRTAIYKFFIWNALLAFAISPSLTQFFSLITPLYEFAYSITNAIHLPFSYEFVLTTGTFVLTSAVIMVLNFLFYDKFVFSKNRNS